MKKASKARVRSALSMIRNAMMDEVHNEPAMKHLVNAEVHLLMAIHGTTPDEGEVVVQIEGQEVKFDA